MTSKNASLFAFVACVAAIFYFDLKKCHDLPWPPRLIMTGLVFGLLDLFSFVSEELSTVMTVGFVIALFVNKAFVGDCSHQELGTAQVKDMSFLSSNVTPLPPFQGQPPSYSAFATPPVQVQ